MIDCDHPLPISKQAKAVGISRGSVYYLPRPVSEEDLELMQRIDRLHLEHPFAGSRMLRDMLKLEGFKVGRTHVSTLMKRMGFEALYRTSHGPPSLVQDTRPIPIYCATWRSAVRTRSGPWTSPTSPWLEGLFTWRP